ncbi:MAG: cupin domain-containing protein [Actinomycetota bacterium]|nr:cupin domain-containing protein [Actinomycetota bacterium]
MEVQGLIHVAQPMIENPVTGERFVFRQTAEDTGGEMLAFDFLLRAGAPGPLPHVHPIQEERFEVIAGTLELRIGPRRAVAGLGATVEVPPGTPHYFKNVGDDEAHLRVEVRPALRLKELLETVAALAREGRLNGRGHPRNLLQLALLAREYEREAYAAYVPLALQRVLLAPLAWIGRVVAPLPEPHGLVLAAESDR